MDTIISILENRFFKKVMNKLHAKDWQIQVVNFVTSLDKKSIMLLILKNLTANKYLMLLIYILLIA